MTADTPLDLDAIQARADAATPGPWEYEIDQQNFDGWDVRHPHGYVAYDEQRGALKVEANAAFIAAARSDVPALVAELRDRRAEVRRLREALQDFAEHGLRADMTPTMNFASTDALYGQFVSYLRRLDESARTRAAAALGGQ